MKRTLATPVAVVAVMVGVPAVLAACTSKDSGTGSIEVTSTADTCDLSSSTAQTGNVSFKVANSGSKVTEFYVYANNNRVLGEVENIGPGLSGNLTVEITDPGTYTVACKPGMVGTGIEKKITVSGEKKQKTDVPADVNAAKPGTSTMFAARRPDCSRRPNSSWLQSKVVTSLPHVRSSVGFAPSTNVSSRSPNRSPIWTRRSTCVGTIPRTARSRSPDFTASNATCGRLPRPR